MMRNPAPLSTDSAPLQNSHAGSVHLNHFGSCNQSPNKGIVMRRNLLNRVRRLHHDEGGFTLIELLIVIVILGVLSAIVVFSVRGITDRGDVSACKANVSTAETAVEAYYAREGQNPGSLALLVPDFLKSDPSDSVGADAVDPKIRVGYDSATGDVTPGTSCD